MASTYSDLKIELIGIGEQTGTWGTTTNNNFSIALSEAITGSADVTFASGPVTLTLTNTNGAQPARNLRLNLVGTLAAPNDLILGVGDSPGCAIEKLYLINNTLGFAVTVKNTAGGSTVTVPAGKSMFVYNTSTDIVDAVTHLSSLTLGAALPVGSGGTGATTLTANNVILGNGTSAVQFVAPGSSGNVLTSNGSAWASAAAAAGGISYTPVKTANYTAVNNDGVQTNTTGGAFTVTLPTTPAVGNIVIVIDSLGVWGTNNLTIGRAGENIAGLAQDLVCDINGATVTLVYTGASYGWNVAAQVGGNGGTVVTLTGTQTLTNKTLGATTLSGTLSVADNLVNRPVLQDYAIEGSAIGNTGATRTFDLAVANFFSATLDQACTFTFSNPPASGDFGAFVLELTNGGAFVITYPASVDFVGGVAPTLTAAGVDQLVFTTRDGGTTYFAFVAGLDIKSP